MFQFAMCTIRGVHGAHAGARAERFAYLRSPFEQHACRRARVSLIAHCALCSSLEPYLYTEMLFFLRVCAQVVLVVDQREQFQRTGHGNGRADSLRVHTDQIRNQGLKVDERTLAIGDVLWVAR